MTPVSQLATADRLSKRRQLTNEALAAKSALGSETTTPAVGAQTGLPTHGC